LSVAEVNIRILKAACFSTDGLQKSMADCVHFNSALTCLQMFLVMILYGPLKISLLLLSGRACVVI
jgi:diacylglycerol kinase